MGLLISPKKVFLRLGIGLKVILSSKCFSDVLRGQGDSTDEDDGDQFPAGGRGRRRQRGPVHGGGQRGKPEAGHSVVP